MKIFWANYKAHNTKTQEWNTFFTTNEIVKKHLVCRPEEADIIVCSGGDGTLLKTVKDYINYGIPIFGINAGTLGFLMNDISAYKFLVDICERKQYKIKKLSTIEVNLKGQTYYAFNDVCIGGDMSSWIEFNVSNKVLPKQFKGGGVIFSTAQGSTGINKNNGGVILPVSSTHWSVTGDKTDINLKTVIKPRVTKIEMDTRQSVTVWVDGNNKVVRDVKSVELRKGPRVDICFIDYEGFVEKRYH